MDGRNNGQDADVQDTPAASVLPEIGQEAGQPLLDVSQVCEALGVSAEALRKRIARKSITPAEGRGAEALFFASDVEAIRTPGRHPDGYKAAGRPRPDEIQGAARSNVRPSGSDDAGKDALIAQLQGEIAFLRDQVITGQKALGQALGALTNEQERVRQLEHSEARLIAALPASGADVPAAAPRPEQASTPASAAKPGFFARLFGRSNSDNE